MCKSESSFGSVTSFKKFKKTGLESVRTLMALLDTDGRLSGASEYHRALEGRFRISPGVNIPSEDK